MKAYRSFLYVALTGCLITALVLVWNRTMFPPIAVQCFSEFRKDMQDGSLEVGVNMPSLGLLLLSDTITSFRCATNQDGFSQYEFHGVDTSSTPVYVHHSSGGRAASGGDGHYDHCFMRDGEVIASERFIGRNGPSEKSVCEWENDFPYQPTSTYEHGQR